MAGLDTVFAFFFGIVLAFLVLVVKNACSRESTSSERNSLLLKSRDKHSRLTVSEQYGEVDELDVDAIDLEAADMYPSGDDEFLGLQAREMERLHRRERSTGVEFSREWVEGRVGGANGSTTHMMGQPLSPGGAMVVRTLLPAVDEGEEECGGGAGPEHCFSDHEAPREIIVTPASMTNHLCSHEKRVGVFV